MKKQTERLMTILLFAALALSASMVVYTLPVAAQATATATATSAATRTPTPTATPIATAIPMASSVNGYVYGFSIGQYNPALSVTGDAFQAHNGMGLSLYSSAGRQTFHVAGDTGKITGTGMTYGSQATYTSGATIATGMVITPTLCIINPSPEITATYTITATGFSSDMTSRSNPIYWMCIQ